MINVAIDGPAGAGKSSIAKAVAKDTGYIYVDTGALYRAVAHYTLEKGVSPDDSAAVVALLDGLEIKLAYSEGVQKVISQGNDVSGKIRTPEVSMAASKVSAIPEVRAFLFDLQKKIAAENNIIMDGRDIGTVVLPDAQLKIFLTASAEERARRRFAELKDTEGVTFESILADIIKRDENDMNRAVSPLKQAEDAVLVDTTEMTIEEVIALLEKMIKETEAKEA
ncbi:MAG: (d)CMP kinase [Oscillospiraceae bacterium]|nr:(d)CMP kinase [Oscillospiraceae bacterium]MBR3536607.1 (d)CMP kinase [Oscillospiraceae bacterium]MBR6836057.1 (d)CMP kinase [Oscillospiraceae bacterium]